MYVANLMEFQKIPITVSHTSYAMFVHQGIISGLGNQ